jgi:hypothetical protein
MPDRYAPKPGTHTDRLVRTLQEFAKREPGTWISADRLMDEARIEGKTKNTGLMLQRAIDDGLVEVMSYPDGKRFRMSASGRTGQMSAPLNWKAPA